MWEKAEAECGDDWWFKGGSISVTTLPVDDSPPTPVFDIDITHLMGTWPAHRGRMVWSLSQFDEQGKWSGSPMLDWYQQFGFQRKILRLVKPDAAVRVLRGSFGKRREVLVLV